MEEKKSKAEIEKGTKKETKEIIRAKIKKF
jgi:hypothetical protein